MTRRMYVSLFLIIVISGCSAMGALTQDKVLGTWEGSDNNQSYTLTFREDNTINVKIDGNEPFEFTARYTIDYTQKPAALDIVGIKLPDDKVVALAGIIVLNKGELRIMSANGETIDSIERPTEFTEDALTLERVI